MVYWAFGIINQEFLGLLYSPLYTLFIMFLQFQLCGAGLLLGTVCICAIHSDRQKNPQRSKIWYLIAYLTTILGTIVYFSSSKPLNSMDEGEELMPLWIKYLARHGNDLGMWFQLVDNLVDCEEYRLAKKAVEIANEKFPEDPRLWRRYGQILTKMCRWRDGKEALRKASALFYQGFSAEFNLMKEQDCDCELKSSRKETLDICYCPHCGGRLFSS